MPSKHNCQQQKVITKLETDITWIKPKLSLAIEKIDKIFEILTKGDGKIKALKYTVYGTQGKKDGLIDKVTMLEDIVKEFVGAVKFGKFLTLISAGNLVALLALFWKIFGTGGIIK